MIIATVTTCPKRWNSYQRMRKNFAARLPDLTLRTFHTAKDREDPRVNNNLNSRAAIRYCLTHLPRSSGNWMLYLEDDVEVSSELSSCLSLLATLAEQKGVDCWYLCNRRNPFNRRMQVDGLQICVLQLPIQGSHALLIAAKHLPKILQSSWAGYADQAIFEGIGGPAATVWQVVAPVLVRHAGDYSTFDPENRRDLEVTYAT